MKDKYRFEKKFREQVLRCSSCGFCHAVCPVFGLTMRPSLSARGKMLLLQEVMEGDLELSPELVESLCQCTTCANCSDNCPSGVSVPDIIREVRKDMTDIGTCHPAFTSMKEVLDKHTNIYAEKAPEDFGRTRNQKAKYVYFIGCVGSYREDEATLETLDLLDRLKLDYTLIDEVCCSGVLEDLGYREIFYGEGVTVIEWADKIEGLLPEAHLRVSLDFRSQEERVITLEGIGALPRDRWEDLCSALAGFVEE